MNLWQKFLSFFFGIRPRVKWEDGVIVTGSELLRYRALYAVVVSGVRALRPDAVQAPSFLVTIRLYERWPIADGLIHYGKVLAPNVIAGDSYGTLCLYKGKKHPLDENILHEMKHCVTGISDHPDWLFPGYAR